MSPSVAQRRIILSMLRAAGAHGVTGTEFLNDERVKHRFGARIEDLRKRDYEIRTDRVSSTVFRYTLISSPASVGEGGEAAAALDPEGAHSEAAASRPALPSAAQPASTPPPGPAAPADPTSLFDTPPAPPAAHWREDTAA